MVASLVQCHCARKHLRIHGYITSELSKVNIVRAWMYRLGFRVLNALVSALEISERRLAKIPTANANESLRRFKGCNISTFAKSKLL